MIGPADAAITADEASRHTSGSDGRVVTVNSAGNAQYHKQQYKIVDGKVKAVDSIGNIQHHKASAKSK